jgi:predicted ATP-grasp superfamily ATP-dependent carboligase
MNYVINVLVFPCGSVNALEANAALKNNVNIKVFGASSISDHGEYEFENYISFLPNISNDNFLIALNKLVKDFKIDVIIPTHDDVVLKLAEIQDEITAKILVHGLKQALICRHKKLIYDLFKNESFCPRIYNNNFNFTNELFPLFCKPNIGQGSKGAFIISHDNSNILDDIDFDSVIISEFLPGEELTVDCFTNYKGDLQFVGPRVRSRVSNGISMRSNNFELTEEINNIAYIISTTLNLNGLWFFQLRKSIDEKWKLLEISLRISGTMNLYRHLGVNFPLLAVYNIFNIDVTILKNNMNLELDRTLKSSYKSDLQYECIYIDFDDTITKNGNVNPALMSFIYKALNLNKKIYLLTKHKSNIKETLKKLKIHHEIFEEIIVLKIDQKKSEFIKDIDKSIFIDNSFKERKDVFEIHGIPVFDVDSIDVL